MRGRTKTKTLPTRTPHRSRKTCMGGRGGVLREGLSSFVLVGNYTLHHFNVENIIHNENGIETLGRVPRLPL